MIKLIAETKETAILVVEDDKGISKKLSDVLSNANYRVSQTKSPHDALELVEQIHFDIIFIDAKLPSMNGLELYLAIKQITPKSIAIMVTGAEKEFEDIAREAVRWTAYAVIKKPLNLDHVLHLLHRLNAQRASDKIVKLDGGS